MDINKSEDIKKNRFCGYCDRTILFTEKEFFNHLDICEGIVCEKYSKDNDGQGGALAKT